MRLPLKLALASTLGLFAIEIGACVALQALRPNGALESAATLASWGWQVSDDAGAPVVATDFEHLLHVHPYLGFMGLKGGESPPGLDLTFNQPELYWPDSPLREPDRSELLVGITGGSVAVGFFLAGGATVLRERLPMIPRFAGRTVRFVLMGGAGFKQPQQLNALQWLLVQGLQLDLLINLDGFNDVALHEIENEPFGVAPIYPRSWRLLVGPKEHPQILGERSYLERRRRMLAAAVLRSPLRWSHARQLFWLGRDRQLSDALLEVTARLAYIERDRPDSFVIYGPRHPNSTVESRLHEMIDIWRKSSLLLDHLCDANGIEYFHFLQPNQYVEGSKPISEDEARLAITSHRGYGSAVPVAYPLLRATGASLVAEGVRFHDLTEVFLDHPEPIYIDVCCHVNALGNAILGNVVADAIASWGD
jgi:hypothetical protein